MSVRDHHRFIEHSVPLARLIQLSPLARTVLLHIEKQGDISAADAMMTYGMTSATLARRIVDLEQAGIAISRTRKTHPVTLRKYTRYSLTPCETSSALS